MWIIESINSTLRRKLDQNNDCNVIMLLLKEPSKVYWPSTLENQTTDQSINHLFFLEKDNNK